MRGTGLLQLHDRWDMVIPPDGRLSAQGWYYETVLATLAGWASRGDTVILPEKDGNGSKDYRQWQPMAVWNDGVALR